MMNLDIAYPLQYGFQDPATPVMQGIISLHDHIFFYLIVTTVFVTWILSVIIFEFKDEFFSHKYIRHGTLIEIIWTVTPAFILISIAFPSFRLLYLMDEVIDPAVTIKVVGHQWYWSYEYSDHAWSIEFDSYMLPTSDLELGQFRLLEVDNRMVVPMDTHVRLIITSSDVIHSWAVPSLGIKLDAIPGRLNQTSMIINREGVFFGQCSEICGVQHGFMPIVVESVKMDNYISWVNNMLDEA
ncbi:cytochrome c oxidase subunit 2 (mitochondrion) [Fonticula alba]|uniref:Cytochrome c oxidase subunit 2 n=1 Tax=Fonticula alba TaxID=691883 RepID=A0A058YZ79_FONAL|nr:cytochrome c oxidase subunit 2 [Fonticula alba]KCV67186.1 cytochrome c oxidase subunit 2 [Fonticula alba]|eukprot:XP_009498409.1 cytochrome c oxidase subunit 2 (mitochondrion) [Fonticula alba]